MKASRRLHLAAEQGGGIIFALRTSRRHDDPELATPSVAVTRWRIGQIPSPSAITNAPEIMGVGRARWAVDLWRAGGAPPGSWTVSAVDQEGRMEEDRQARRAAGVVVNTAAA